ncbi:OmpA family protein [Parapedobacter tibetensis]|uniref:OmpA family protein n=1 Tax=Parapedobacter tibetensis TaxID=2972951 RepID=UPI00214DC89B|nr:OmpA family protein [Parapedobacter tibetensis]
MKESLFAKIYVIMALAIMALITICILLVAPAYAQEQPNLRDRADELYRRYEYANASVLYEKLANRRKPRLQDLERLADSYTKMNDYESAEKWYSSVIEHEDSAPENLRHYGQVLKVNGKYEEAKQQLEAYASLAGDRESVARQIAGCDSSMVWIKQPTGHHVQNEAAVNTDLSEFATFPNDGAVYYTGEPGKGLGFNSYGWTGNAFLRIYSAKRSTDNRLSSPQLADAVPNDERYHIGPIATDNTGSTLFVTRTYPGKEGEVTKERRKKYRTQNLELYIYTKTSETGQWEATPFPYNDVQKYSLGHAALSNDGNILYFASDMPGGYGGTDIWFCKKQTDGSWGTPVNAGSAVNSEGEELFPNIGPDNSLYYSSDGLVGMGGLDIFHAEGSGDRWSESKNLRYPINSSGDDFAYIGTLEDEENVYGYLSSNRTGGKGADDIYSFTLDKPKIIIILQGTTSDKQTGARLAGTAITLFDGEREIVARQSSTREGTFEFVLDRNRVYSVLGTKEGYQPDSAAVSTMGIVKSDTLEVALLLEPEFVVGQNIELENIYYNFDKHNIRPDAAEILDRLVQIMNDYPTLKIRLSSHTDSRGSDEYNMGLSQRRAQAAVDYLVGKGIVRERMIAQGFGESQLVNKCANGVPCSREAHQANRRTEVTVLEY